MICNSFTADPDQIDIPSKAYVDIPLKAYLESLSPELLIPIIKALPDLGLLSSLLL